MGTLYYGDTDTPIHIEDRALAHLKVVISTKLRRHESFTLSWVHPEGKPRGRSTIWLHPSIPMRFIFEGAEPPELNPQWVKELANSANSSGGITLVAEQIETGPVDVPQSDAPTVSVGKLHLEDLNVDKLTVAGTEVAPGQAGLNTPALENG